MTRFYNKTHINQERASASDLEKNMRGSVTVEAALAVPVFLFAVLALVYLLEIQAIRLAVNSAAQGAAKMASEDMAVIPVFNPIKLKTDIVSLIGAERLERSIVEGGSSGIHCWRSWYDTGSGVLHIELDYKVRLPLPKFVNTGMKCRNSFLVKAWTGYENAGAEKEDDQIVYVTESGGVYHTDYQCSYLQLSIRFVPYSRVSDLRNEDGGRYHACGRCMSGGASAGVYVTDYGNKFHSSLNCSGLKRTIHSVKKGECQGMGVCNKCAQ